MVDKYEVKEYVASIIGDEYIIPTLGVWERFEDVDFDSLPNQFVLKCTHDSGGLVIVRDKTQMNMAEARKKIERSLRQNYFYRGREWCYKDVPPRVIAEQYIEEENGADLKDYKLMCFNGHVKCCFVCADRHSKNGLHLSVFDRDWMVLPVRRRNPVIESPVPKPEKYEMMIQFAETLSKNIPFVRVDFYEVAGHVYFGEMTFFPAAGFEEFIPSEWDLTLGNWLHLPERQ